MIAHAARTQTGRTRAENQDRVAADPARGCYIVVDGIGGLADAAATAEVVVDQFPARVLDRVTALTGSSLGRAVTGAAAEVNDRVRLTARYGPGTTGAATALLLVRDATAVAVHLGDSRIYHARGGHLERLTDDHAVAGQLTQFMGMRGAVAPGVSVHQLRAGDRILLCTDGLTDGVQDAALRSVLASAGEVADICRQLVEAAVAGGASDDISVVVVEYGGGRPGDGAAAQR